MFKENTFYYATRSSHFACRDGYEKFYKNDIIFVVSTIYVGDNVYELDIIHDYKTYHNVKWHKENVSWLYEII